MSCHPRRTALWIGFLQRMRAEIQPVAHVVTAGSNPAGREAVAQVVQSSLKFFADSLVAAFFVNGFGRVLGECRWNYIVISRSRVRLPPASQEAVAQWQSRKKNVSSTPCRQGRIHRVCGVNAGRSTGKSVMVLAMKVPGPTPGLFRQIAQSTTCRSSSPLFLLACAMRSERCSRAHRRTVEE